MKKFYKYTGKICLMFYTLTLFFLFLLCKYGSLNTNGLLCLLSLIITGILFIVWIKKRKSEGKVFQFKHLFKMETIVFLCITVFFSGMIIYTAIPFNGYLSWYVYDYFHEKKVELKHTNIFDSGIAGILTDLDGSLDLPDELYISNSFTVQFDRDGNIQSIYAFLYGKNDNGNKKTYLVEYDKDISKNMTIHLDVQTNGNFEDDMKLSPMIDILGYASWQDQVETWARASSDDQIYELLYMGKRGFTSPEGLVYAGIPEDPNNPDDILRSFLPLYSGGEIRGYEVSLHIPDDSSIIPVRYMNDLEYISQSKVNEEQYDEFNEKAKQSESWSVDQSNGSMYFYLNDKVGWKLVVEDAAAGSRFYVLEWTENGGITWKRIHDDPFQGEIGVVEGLIFFDENLGFAGLTHASQSDSLLYVTYDGGLTFQKVNIECDSSEYDYYQMPEKDGEVISVTVTKDGSESAGIVYESYDLGETWIQQ